MSDTPSFKKEAIKCFMSGATFENKGENIKVKRTTSYIQLVLNNKIIAERLSFDHYKFFITASKMLGAIEYLKLLPGVNISYDNEGFICLNEERWNWESGGKTITNY